MVIIFFIACGKREEKLVIEQPQPIEIREVSEEEIDEFNLIVEAIIHQNNLAVLKTDKDSENLLLEFLIKTPIDLNEIDSEGNKSLPSPGAIFISELIGNRFENKVYFTSEDSLYIMQQNTYPDTIKIMASILEKVNTKENEKQELKENPDLYFGEFEISIPILSKDRQTAYVELGYFCGALCGNGSVLILKKIHGKWKVVEDISSWIS
ncbi:hypothetical protein EG240_14965 [Paenimyroides tangerinum]|uniref:Uncharacterized protein n=1 Tax=Paenimyroides tangerinum TaxID=2488728 RepID=A0A3P3W4B5_9FLAO|nr:hypothetical protein [Paenimyroides tangerinum]RRJ87653.1 hypothetical protein EG240_14965 [Paenimyroides tangerinum]